MKKSRGQIIYQPDVRLQRLSVADPATGCWNWVGSTDNGYGKLMVGSRSDKTRKSIRAHRFSYLTFVGPITDGLYVCHRCDNRLCINPAHLFLGTHQDNMDDRGNKGRLNHVVGEQSGTARLTEVDVLSARRLRFAGRTYQSIADRFGVDKRTVMRAVKGETWAHLPAAPSAKEPQT